MKLEVRDSLSPNTIMGWIDVPDENVRDNKVKYLLLSQWPPMEVHLEIRTVNDWKGDQYKAIHSGAVRIEQLRKIPGFRENK